MSLSNGLYLGHKILAVCNNWLIVYDGKYNYYLFLLSKSVLARHSDNQMPSNTQGSKQTEYYSTFDNAFNNLFRCVIQEGFDPCIHPREIYR